MASATAPMSRPRNPLKGIRVVAAVKAKVGNRADEHKADFAFLRERL